MEPEFPSQQTSPTAPPVLSEQDDGHLKLLSILMYVYCGLMALTSMIPAIHLALGIAMASGVFSATGGNPPPPALGWMFIVLGSCAIVCGLIYSLLVLGAAVNLARRRRRTYCLMIAGLSCLNMPMGTVLGVFIIVVLTRPQVKAVFEANMA